MNETESESTASSQEISRMMFFYQSSGFFLTFLSTIALLVNLYLLSCSRYLRRPIGVNLRLCVSLTASDALCAMFYILTFSINVLIPQGIISTCWSLVIEVGKYASFFASVFTLLFLALNHYVGIVYPLKRHVITPHTVRLAMALSYIVPFAFFFLLLCIHPGGFRADDAFAFFSPSGCRQPYIFQAPSFRWVVVLPFILIVLLLSFLYAHILVHMGRIQKDPLLHSNMTTTKRSSNKKLLVTLVLLAGSACLCWLPTMIGYLVTCNDCVLPLSNTARFILGFVTQTLHISKLIMDAFIYSSRLIEIKYSMFIFGDILKNRIRGLLGMHVNPPALPSEFTRYLSETKENRSMRRKNTQLLSPSPKSFRENYAKRASSVVVIGSNGKHNESIPITHLLKVDNGHILAHFDHHKQIVRRRVHFILTHRSSQHTPVHHNPMLMNIFLL